jgi:hypothetical protein
MTYWDLIDTQERDGFTLELHFTPEEDDPAGHFASGGDEADAELCARIRDGDLLWFVARVTASKAGIALGVSYLGGCCYASAAEFMQDGYFDDMVSDAITEARGMLARLREDDQ